MTDWNIYRAELGTAAVDAVHAAFAGFSGSLADVCAIIFSADDPIDRGIVDAVISGVSSAPFVRHVYLIHPSPLLGFLTSSICLRIPSLRVRSCASLQAARELHAKEA